MTAPEPLVSVVIPVFNGERFLAAAIQSALDQTYRPLEVIVVDDGSTDESASIARSFPGVRVIEQAHAGPGAARNRAISAADGELLAFLDADDLMPADKLARQVGYLREHPDVGCVLGRQELFAEGGGSLPTWALPPARWQEQHPELSERGVIQPLSVVAWRSVVDAIGEFSTEFGEDVDWLCRVWGSDVRVDTIDAVVVRRRMHDANLTHDTGASRLAMFRALKGHAERSRAPAALVSVVIPVFNGERFLAAAIQSALDQTYRPLEVIVVDDGSTDGSASIARSFPAVRVIEQAHAGPATARNRGVAIACGGFLAFLDADDLMPADKLARQVGYLDEHPDAGCVLGRQEFLLEEGVEWPLWAGNERREAPLMSMVVRASLFDQVGGFDPTYVHGEDADCLLRLRQRAGVATLDSIVVHRRIHSGNLSNDVRALRRGTFRVLRDHMRRLRAEGRSSTGRASG